MTTRKYGGGGGNVPYDYTCPDGTFMTGMKVRSGSRVDGITGFYCKKPTEFSSGNPGTLMTTSIGGGGGNESIFTCPTNSGLSDVNLSWHDDYVVDWLRLGCSDLQSGAQTGTSSLFGADHGGPTDSIHIPYLTGAYGRGVDYLDSISFRYKDPSAARAALYTDEGKVQCCMGLTDGSMCGMTPQSAPCDQFMIQYCQSHFTDPRCACVNSEMTCPNKFDSKCIKNNGYRSTDMVTTPCPNVMNCTQFVSLSPGAQAIATNVDQNCASAQTQGATKTTTPISATMPTTGGQSTGLTTTSGLVWIFIILLIVILVGVMIFIFASGDEEETPETLGVPETQV